jgi:hypothetical protein
MDETAVWFDMVGSSTVDFKGAKSIALKTTGHEKARLSVILAAKADGSKLKPYIVVKGSTREIKREETTRAINGVILASSSNGWMNDDLTRDWLQHIVGKLASEKRILIWE